MRFSDTLLRQVRDRVSIADYAGKRLSWHKQKSRPSAGDFWACCPFHQEKSPSFHVLDQKGLFKCFGCGEKGDVFTLAMKLEGLSFPEAVEKFADIAGVALPKDNEEAHGPFANLPNLLNAARDILNQREQFAAADVLSQCSHQLEKTGRDNWNGGTDTYTLWLRLAPSHFASLDAEREQLSAQINGALEPLMEQEASIFLSIRIAPAFRSSAALPPAPRPIDRELREAIADTLLDKRIPFQGSLKHTEFLGRLYELEKLPSFDPRFNSALGDISTHCDSFADWDANWVFYDRRFELLKCSDETFLKFLCEMLHPKVRRDRGEALALAAILNNELQHAGWSLREETLNGRRKYVAQSLSRTAPPTKSARTAADFLDAEFMHLEISRAESAIQRDPALAIGTAKDLVETCCKTLLGRLGLIPPTDLDTPQLANLLLNKLELAPRSVPDVERGATILRALLANFANIPHRLSELRNLYGTGHGKDGKFKGLEPHHAQLAVTAAVAFVHFAVDEYRRQISSEPAR